jgi:hypothetical protein
MVSGALFNICKSKLFDIVACCFNPTPIPSPKGEGGLHPRYSTIPFRETQKKHEINPPSPNW